MSIQPLDLNESPGSAATPALPLTPLQSFPDLVSGGTVTVSSDRNGKKFAKTTSTRTNAPSATAPPPAFCGDVARPQPGPNPGPAPPASPTPAVPPLPAPPATKLPELPELGDVERTMEGQELLAEMERARRELDESAKSDQQTLEEPYLSLPTERLQEHFERSRATLDQWSQNLVGENSSGGNGDGELARFRSLLLSARDKSTAAAEVLSHDQKSAATAFDFARPGQPLSRSTSLANLFGTSKSGLGGASNPTSNEALTNRMVLYGGLTDADRRAIDKKLKLLERKQIPARKGTIVIPILHNGYLLGAGKTGIDCSSLVSQSLPLSIRKGHLTTLDFRTIWVFRTYGIVDKPPTYDDRRKDLVLRMAMAFDPLDLRLGDRLQAGDLLVYRLPFEASGHVFAVKSYDPWTMKARVIEASQSAGTIRERDFSITLDPADAAAMHAHRRVRTGLFALRLRSQHNRVCQVGKPS